jgi:polysaccharide biosynthesis protein PslH
MKILFLTHRVPYPPNKGDKIRSYNEMIGLIERRHEVHLLAFADNSHDLSYLEFLGRLCASVQVVPLDHLKSKLRASANLFTSRPFSLGYFASTRMKRLVEQALAGQRFDAIFVYSSLMAQYVKPDLETRTVIDLVDVDSEKWREYGRAKGRPLSWLYNSEWRRLRRYEYEIISRFSHSILSTPREASLLDKLDELTRRSRLHVMTNGVDLDYYRPELVAFNAAKPRLVFTGAMNYYANIDGVRWFIEEVFPFIRRAEPGAEFLIVGSNPTSQVKKLGQREGVTITGFVEDIRPYLHGAHACVVPLRIARGIQNKILEGMAAGKAVIATPEAVAGLRVANGEQLLVAGKPREFAAAALKLIRDPGLRRQLGYRARRFVESEHDWEPILREIVDLVESVACKPRVTRGWRPMVEAELRS